MAHKVTAAVAVVYDAEDRQVMVYADALLPDGLRDGEADRLTELGMVVEVPDPTPDPEEGEKPSRKKK